MSISASLVKNLRERTGAGMMDCKKALSETNGDFDAAVDYLRAKGLAAAAKKSSRVAAQGLTAVAVRGTVGVAVELNSETDFVARNDKFQALLDEIVNLALDSENIEELNAKICSSGETVAQAVVSAVATIGENIHLRRMSKISVAAGVVVPYIHNAVKSNMGRIATLVALESEGDAAQLLAAGKQLAMHVAAAKPMALNVSELDPAAVQKERDFVSEQSKSADKPKEIIEKMIEGRMQKFYKEVVFLEQTFVVDGETKVSNVVDALAKEVGKPVTLKAYTYFELGQGIEVEQADFAAEVASMAK